MSNLKQLPLLRNRDLPPNVEMRILDELSRWASRAGSWIDQELEHRADVGERPDTRAGIALLRELRELVQEIEL
jgi:hypothetical protein